MVRSRLIALLRATVRMQRLDALTRLAEVVAARRNDDGGWEIAVVRHGRLAGGGHLAAPAASPADAGPGPGHRGDGRTGGLGPVPAATAEETERILAWLERPDTRLGGNSRRLGVTGRVAPRGSVTC